MAFELKKKARPPIQGPLKAGGNRLEMERARQRKEENDAVFGADEFPHVAEDPDDDPVDDPDYGLDDGDDENDDDHEPPYELLPKPMSVASPIAAPLRKGPSPLKKPTPLAAAPAKEAKASTERSRLSCEISRTHHRRLKIHAAFNDESIVSIIEGWIDEHCPPL